MTKDTQRHGKVAACHARIAHGSLGRGERENRQAAKSGQISGVCWKTPLCSQWEMAEKGLRLTQSSVKKETQPLPKFCLSHIRSWCLGAVIVSPGLGICQIPAPTVHWSPPVPRAAAHRGQGWPGLGLCPASSLAASSPLDTGEPSSLLR